MITLRQINIKNRPYYFFNDMINIINFDPNLLSMGKISFIYDTKYIPMNSLDSENIDSKNPLCLIFTDVDAYIIDENNGCKYLIFNSTKNNKSVLKRYKEIWNEIENQNETINGGKPIEYKKYLMKIRFSSNDDDLPLDKL